MNLVKNILVKANQDTLKFGANQGWVFPLNLPYPVYKQKISELGGTEGELDKFFIEFFMSDFELNVENIILDYKKDIPEYLLSLLEGCFFAFKNQHYQICIPALFSVLEGLLVDLSNNGARNAIRYKQGIDELKESEEAVVEVLPLMSISYFVEFSFGKSDFDNLSMGDINRHWSQHGRYLHDLSEKAPLQLFNAVALVLFTQSFLKKL